MTTRKLVDRELTRPVVEPPVPPVEEPEEPGE